MKTTPQTIAAELAHLDKQKQALSNDDGSIFTTIDKIILMSFYDKIENHLRMVQDRAIKNIKVMDHEVIFH